MATFLTAKFAQVDTSINDTQARITALPTKLSELQEYRQQLLSIEQACKSALSQMSARAAS